MHQVSPFFWFIHKQTFIPSRIITKLGKDVPRKYFLQWGGGVENLINEG
ncbi:hypothetical protein BLGI_892 [Brevibacillus laterosporus GI-9]|nr:hypothetical protein BLGI_892 [Brevibacillus laterosporus GI-9]